MRLLISLCFIGTALFSTAQSYSKVYFDQTAYVYAKAVTHTDTNGIVIAGIYNSEALVYRIDENGDILWQKTWSNPVNLYPHFDLHQVLPVADSNFVVIGRMSNDSTQSLNALIMKLDADGNLLWKRSFENTGHSVFHSTAVQTADSGYMLAWGGFSQGNGFSIVKLDVDGNLLWTQAYDDGTNINITDIEKINDSLYFLIGSTVENNSDYAGVIIPLDENGTAGPSKKYADLYFDDLEINGAQIAVCGKSFAMSGKYFLALGNTDGELLYGSHPETWSGSGALDEYCQVVAITDTNYVLYTPQPMWSGIAYEVGTNGEVYQKMETEAIMADVMHTSEDGVFFLGGGPLYGIKKTIWPEHIGTTRTDSTLIVTTCGSNYPVQPTLLGIPMADTIVWTNSTTQPTQTEQPIFEAAANLTDTLTCIQFWGGIDEINGTLPVSVYPNSSDDLFTFELASPDMFSIRIVSSTGQLIMESTEHYDRETVSLAGFANGIYYYFVASPDGKSASGKLLLNK